MRTGPGASSVTLTPEPLSSPRSDSENVLRNAFDAATIAAWPNAEEIVWCQEEPQNQGAWYQIRHRLIEPLSDGQPLYYAGRPSAAAPAAGLLKTHLREQQALVEAALGVELKASQSVRPARSRRSAGTRSKRKKGKSS